MTSADIALDRFEAKVSRQSGPAGCWYWLAYRAANGYDRFRNEGRLVAAHRWAYEHFVGPIPAGHDLDHLCRVRHCVNPAHLEPVTRSENNRRGLNGALRTAESLRTSCAAGHPYDETNTYFHPQGWRMCRICKRAWEARTRDRNNRLRNGRDRERYRTDAEYRACVLGANRARRARIKAGIE